MRVIISIHIILFLSAFSALAQVTDTIKVDSTNANRLDSMRVDSLSQLDIPELVKEPEVIKTVSFWEKNKPAYSNTVNTDSLMRWQFWPNWGDFYAHRKDAISYRLGTIGRVDAFTIRGYDSYEQILEFDDIQLNNPITGLLNYNLVPHLKLDVVNETHTHNLKTDIYSKNYYITQPRSFLNYDEGGSGYRNLEFMVTQNTSPGTNIELSYWDRREDGYYPNSKVIGSQIFGKVYHHIQEKYFLQATILRNEFNNGEPFGYNIGDPNAFNFDEFTAQPNQQSAKSEFLRNDIKVGIYTRKDSTQKENGGLVFIKTRNDYNLKASVDTIFWDINEYKAKLFKEFNLNKFDAKFDLTGYKASVKDSSSLSIKSWSGAALTGLINAKITNSIKAFTSGNYHLRSDSKGAFALNGGLQFSSKIINAKLGISSEDKNPSIQNMHWLSNNYSGNKDLKNEKILSAYGELNVNLKTRLKFGITGRYKQVENAILLSDNNTFDNAGNYSLINSSIYGRYDSKLLEIESSAVLEHLLDYNYEPDFVSLNKKDNIIQLRNSIFIKGYVFDRAAFLKAGIKTIFSPDYYQSKMYNTELNYWQNNSTENPIPGYFRLDAELSARVRAIMVYVSWENALDGLGQLGYFETASYPLWPRRLLIGIRAQFKN